MAVEKNNSAFISSAIAVIAGTISSLILINVNKTDQAAPRDYVDKRLEKVEQKLDQKADKNDIIEIKATLTTMNSRLYDLWASAPPQKQRQ